MAESNTQSKSKGKYWLIFLVHLVAIVIITIMAPAAFWLPLPGLVTAFALANDWI
jgi:hypothetical protein